VKNANGKNRELTKKCQASRRGSKVFAASFSGTAFRPVLKRRANLPNLLKGALAKREENFAASVIGPSFQEHSCAKGAWQKEASAASSRKLLQARRSLTRNNHLYLQNLPQRSPSQQNTARGNSRWLKIGMYGLILLALTLFSPAAFSIQERW
jgi:hypothetical protein